MQDIKRTKKAFVNARTALLKAKDELTNKTTWRNNEVDLYRFQALNAINNAIQEIYKFHLYHPEEK